MISVPLKFWFSSAYISSKNLRDRHYQMFEALQLDWLLEKIGGIIIASNKWTNPIKKMESEHPLGFLFPDNKFFTRKKESRLF